MGVTVGVNSLKEMCDMMCDNKLPEEKEEETMTKTIQMEGIA